MLQAFDFDDIYAATPVIRNAEYEPADINAVAQAQTHLTSSQRDELAALLREFPRLFDGKLRCYPDRKVHFELIDGEKPVHQRPYDMPHAYRDVFKTELDHICQIGVLKKVGMSEWGSPSFIIPKLDCTVRWISDFRALNKVIKRRIWPMPRIPDIVCKRPRYAYFTKLDVSMMFYTFELTEESKDLCTIVTPWGKYRYERVPMGIKQSPDVAQ